MYVLDENQTEFDLSKYYMEWKPQILLKVTKVRSVQAAAASTNISHFWSLKIRRTANFF